MLQRKWPVVALAVSLAAFFYFYNDMSMKETPGSIATSISTSDADSSFNYLYASLQISDSTPYYQYKKMADSFGQMQTMRRLENRSISHGGVTYGFIGVNRIRRYENLHTANDDDSSFRYYISLGGYELPAESFFFIQNGTYNVGYVSWDSVQQYEDRPVHMGHHERKRIPVRFNSEDGRVLIPISKRQYDAFNTGLQATYISFSVVMLFFFLGLPAQVLINISKGRAFDLKNIRYLNWVAIGLLVYALLDISAPYLVRFYFSSEIPSDFTRATFWQTILEQFWTFFGAAAFFMIAKAFKRGYKLQQEQDLTI